MARASSPGPTILPSSAWPNRQGLEAGNFRKELFWFEMSERSEFSKQNSERMEKIFPPLIPTAGTPGLRLKRLKFSS